MADTDTPSACPDCPKLRAELDALKLELQQLKQQLKLNSRNSSKPPSSDPPWQRPPPSSPTGRKPGGQPGHKGHFRTALEPTTIRPYIPTQCACCGLALSAMPAPVDPAPIRHQVLELPEHPVEIIDHQSHARTCQLCGHVTRAPIPDEFKSSIVGPRLSAALSFWVAKGHVSRRFVLEMLDAVYQVPLSLGTLVACETEMAAALQKPHEAIRQAVRAASAVNIDETSWRCFQARPWVWVVAASKAVLYGIQATRGGSELKALLDNLKAKRTVGSDRFPAYNAIPMQNRQMCWAHLIRDFVRLVEVKNGAEVLGQAGLDAAKAAFEVWYLFKDDRINRAELTARMRPIRDTLKTVFEQQQRDAPLAQTRRFAKRILPHYPALWTFVEKDGVEPTNNEAERMLRTMVQWRKNSYGCHSAGGCVFAERVMSVIQTLRKQSQSILSYLTAALQAHRASKPAPTLIAAF